MTDCAKTAEPSEQQPALRTAASRLCPVSVAAANWQGRLALTFCDRQGETYLSRCFVQAPLKVQRPFYPEGRGVCHGVMLHTAGGIVGGDRLSTTLQLEANAHALLTTATAGKVYRSNGQEAQQEVQISLASGACLEWLPQETIVFNGAEFRQQLRVDLEPGALWMGWEIARLGRSARGERFVCGNWRSHTQVWQAGRLIWVDPQWVAGGSEMMESLHGLAGYPVIASFALLGHPVSGELVERVRSLWEALPEQEVRSQHGVPRNVLTQVGVTRLMSGLLCRYRGTSTQEARRWFTTVWHLLRWELLNRPPCLPRVW